jgi:predicted PurR-regulated permease PerM
MLVSEAPRIRAAPRSKPRSRWPQGAGNESRYQRKAGCPCPFRWNHKVHREIDLERNALAAYTHRVLIAVGVVALAILAWQLAEVLVLVFAGVVLACALRALSDPLDAYTPLSGRVSLAIVVAALLAFLAAAFWLVGEQLVVQIGQLSELLPGGANDVREWLQQSPIGAWLVTMSERGVQVAQGSLSGIARFASTTVGTVANAILILFLGLYLAADPGLYQRGLLRLVPPSGRQRTAAALQASGRALKRWLLGQLLAMVCVGLITGIGLWLLDVPLALSLGLIAGLLEFVPFIGPILAAIPALLVAFTQDGWTPLYVLLLYLGIQQIEGNVLMPVIQKWAVSLPPALGLLGVVIFGLLFGIVGVLFAMPLMVVVMVFVQKLYVDTALEPKPPSPRP